MNKLEVIVCPVFEAISGSAISRAAELARTFDAKLLILKVIDNSVRSLESPGTPYYRERRLDHFETESIPILEGIAHEQHELIGDSTVGVRDFAIRNEADLVVIGNASAFGGGDAIDARTRRIADSIPCAVMIIKEETVVPVVHSAQSLMEMSQA